MFCPPDQPNIDVPEDIVSDESLELTCYAPDNCPDMNPEIQWMYTDYLPDPEFASDYLEESNTAVLSSTLTFIPRPMHNGQLLGCRVFYPNTTLVYERLISLDIKCKFKSTAPCKTNKNHTFPPIEDHEDQTPNIVNKNFQDLTKLRVYCHATGSVRYGGILSYRTC